jgi:hypothetical protein
MFASASLRSVVPSFLLLACSQHPTITPATGGRYGLSSDNGISLVADPRAWDGTPGDLEDYATPIAVEIHNGSRTAIAIRLADISLSEEGGRRMPAWRIEGREEEGAQPTRERQPQVPDDEPPPSSAPVQPDASAEENILWDGEQPWDDAPSVETSAGVTPALWIPGATVNRATFTASAPPRGGLGGGGAAPSRPSMPSAPPRMATPARPSAPPRGGYFGHSPSRTYAPNRPDATRPYATPRTYGGYGGGGYYRGYRGGFGGYYGYSYPWGGYGGYYQPYWYGTPGFSPLWWGYGPTFGWGWGYSVSMGPGVYWGGSLPPERTDIVRLGLVDGTLQPGSTVRGFVYFGSVSPQAGTIHLEIPLSDAKTKKRYAHLQTTFHVLHND